MNRTTTFGKNYLFGLCFLLLTSSFAWDVDASQEGASIGLRLINQLNNLAENQLLLVDPSLSYRLDLDKDIIGKATPKSELKIDATCTGNADAVSINTGVVSATNALNGPDDTGATLNDSGDQLGLDLTDILQSGEAYTIRWRRNTGTSSNPSFTVEESSDGTTWVAADGSPFTVSSTAWADNAFTANTNTRYIRLTTTDVYDLDVDAVTYSSVQCLDIVSSSTEGTPSLSFVDVECASTVTTTITVADNITITDVNIGLNVSLEYRHHLTATVTSPSGTVVELTSSGAYSGGSTTIHNWDVLFDESSSNGLNDGGSDDVNAPYYENERIANPSGDLNAFNGENSSGVWTLAVCDAVTSTINGGTVNRWKIDIMGETACPANSDTPVNTTGTCNGNTANADATTTLNNIVNADKIGISTAGASSYDGPDYASASSITGNTHTFTGLEHGKNYIIRLFETGGGACFSSRAFTSATAPSACPELPSGLPWAGSECAGKEIILQNGIAALTCGVTSNVSASERYTFAMMDLNNVIPADKSEVTSSVNVYHHPSWHVDSIGNVYGTAINSNDGSIYVAASTNYAAGFTGQLAITRFGGIAGGTSSGDNDVAAAGAIYKIDPTTGQATLFTNLPQQSTSFTHIGCEDANTNSRTGSGVGLGNITFDSTHNQFFVSNIEDGRIYRLDETGNILDSYDPFSDDDGVAGISDNEELVYGLVVEPNGSRLLFGTVDYAPGADAQPGSPGIYSIDLTSAGGFTGTSIATGQGYDNYTGTETLHTTIPTGGPSPSTFVADNYLYHISDLAFNESGNLVAGVRVGCDNSFFSSYNHYGESNIISINGSNLYTNITELDISATGQAANEDGYGGVATYIDNNGNNIIATSSADIVAEIGPHGIAVFNDPPNSGEITPLAAISYGVDISGDPKGVGGDIEIYTQCTGCAPPTATILANQSTCIGETAQSDGYLQLTAFTNADKISWSTGNTFTGNTNYVNATDIGVLPFQFNTGLSNPVDSQEYTVRVFNGASDCFIDVVVTLQAVSCETPCSAPGCDPVPTATVCSDGTGTVTLTSDAGLTNVIWYNSKGDMVSQSTDLTIDNTMIGDSSVGQSECFYYLAEDAQTCDGKSCCPVTVSVINCCAEINQLITDRTICSGDAIDSLAATTTFTNPDSIAFVYFSTPQTDSSVIYTGGTGIDTLQISASSDTVLLTNVTVGAFTATTSPDTFYVYAIKHPTPAVNTCRPHEEILVIVNPIDTTDITQEICEGTTHNFNNQDLSTAGEYLDTLTQTNGCDSLIRLTLTVNKKDTTDITQLICEGTTHNFNNQDLSTAGEYLDTLSQINGCDSLIRLTLTVNKKDTTDIAQAICEGTTYNFNNHDLSTAGEYLDTLSQTNGCDSIIRLTLTLNPSPDLATTDTTICNGTTIDLNNRVTDNNSLAGTTSFHANISDANSGSSPLASSITPNTTTRYYIRKVTTADNCPAVDSTLITVQDSPDLATTNQTVCAGESVNLSTLVTDNAGTSGTTTYHNSLADAQAGSNNLGSNLTPVITTKYYIRKSTTTGACVDVDSLTVIVQPLPDLATTDATICEGTTIDLGNQVTDNNGTTGSQTYFLSLVDLNSGANIQSNPVSPSTTTKYYVKKLTDTNSCQDIDSLMITVQPLPNLTTRDTTLCAGEPVDLANQTTDEAGTTGMMTYHTTLTDAQGGTNVLGSTSVSPVADAKYYVRKVTTTGSCLDIDSIAITIQPVPELATTDSTICNGVTIDIAGLATDNAGTTGTMTYHPSLTDAQGNSNPLASTSVNPSADIKYYVRKETTTGNCVDLDSIAITVQPNPDLATTDATICAGISVDLNGQVTDNANTTGTTTFHSTLADAQGSSNDLGSATVSPSATQKYYVLKTTTTTNCTDIDSLTITVQPLPDLTTKDTLVCAGENVDIAVLVTDDAGTTGTISYHNTATDAQSGSNALGSSTVNSTATTKYYVRKSTTTASCVNVDSLTVTRQPAPELVTLDSTICATNAVDLAGLVTDNAGTTGTVTFHTSDADAQLGMNAIASSTVSPSITTTYHVRKETTTGSCYVVNSLTITVQPNPDLATIDATICNGASIDLNGQATDNANTTGSMTYHTSMVDAQNVANALGSTTVSPVATTKYYIQKTTTAANCQDIDSLTITVQPLPDLLTSDVTICEGVTVDLIGQVSDNNATIGTTTFHNSLADAQSTSNALGSSMVTPSVTTKYYVSKVTTTASCADVDSITITVQPLPDLTTQNDTLCIGENVDISTLVTDNAGTTGTMSYHSNLADAQGNTSPLGSTTVSPTTTTKYFVRKETTTGSCTAIDSLTIEVEPVPDLSTTDANLCAGESVDLATLATDNASLTGMMTYHNSLADAQSGVNSLASTDVTPAATTKYYVRKTAGTQACLDVDSINVTINPLPADAVNPANGNYCDGATIPTIQVDDPGAGFNVTWWNASTGGSMVTGATLGGANNEQITLSASSSPAAPVVGNTTTVYAEVMNTTTNCVSANRVAVTLTNNELPTIDNITPMVCSGEMTTLSATVNGGTTPYSYMWQMVGSVITPFSGSSSSTDAMPVFDATGLANNTYMIELSLTDNSGCMVQDTFDFVVQAGPDATFSNLTDEVCEGDTDVVYAVEDQGAGAAYGWTFTNASVISGGTATDTFIVVNWDQGGTSGDISVNITLASGCTGQNQTTVTIHPKPILTAASNSPLCAGDTLKLNSTTTTGTAAFNYAWTGPNTFTANVENPIIADATVAANGSYQVIVTDMNTCSDTATTAVTVEQVPDLATRDTTVCPSEPVDLSSLYIDNNATTGTTTYHTTLADAQSGSNDIGANQNTGTTTKYYLRKSITNVPNCTAIDSLTITIQPNPDLSTSDELICNGQTIDLSTLVMDNAATTGTLTYHSTLADAQNEVGDIGNSQSPTVTTKYYLLKTTATIACTNIDSLTITVQDLPDLVTLDSTICENTTIDLAGLVTDNASTTGTMTYHTTLADANSGSAAIASGVTPVLNTKYYVRKSTTTGSCIGVDSMNVTLQSAPDLVSRDTTICEGQTVDLNTQVVDNAGTTGATTFHSSWSDAVNGNNPLGSASVTPNFTSKYFVRKMTDVGNCADYDSLMVTVQPLPNLVGTNATICTGASIDLSTLVTDNANTNGALTYHATLPDAQTNVNPIGSTQSPTNNTTYYILKTTDNSACTDIVEITINVQPNPDLVTVDSTICAGISVDLSGLVTDNAGTTGATTFHTTHVDAMGGTGAITSTVSPSGTTQYYVRKITTGSNCANTDSLTITIQPNPALETRDSLICNGESVDLSTLVTDNAATVGTMSYYDNLADAEGNINALVSSNVTPVNTTKYYIRKETTTAACTDLDSLTITLQDAPDLATMNPVICAEESVDLSTLVTDNANTTGTLTYHSTLADAQGGINDIGNSHTPTNDTTYYVLKTTTAGSCTNIDSISIMVQLRPDLVPRDTTICGAETVDLSTLVTDNAGTVGTTTFHSLLADANSGTNALATNVSPITTTRYYIRKVTTTANCVSIDSLNINIVTPADLVTRDSSICAGESADLASLFIDDAGTTGTMAYYTTLADANAGTNSISSTVTPANDTKYYLSKTVGGQNCATVDSLEITILPLPNLATTPTTICPSDPVDLSTLVTDNANTLGTTTYHNSLAEAISSSNNVGPNQNPAVTTKYYIRKISTNNCLAIDSVMVNVQPLPDLSVLPGSICAGGSIDLKTLVTDNAGTAGTLTCHSTLEGALNGTAVIVSTVSPTAESKYYFRKVTTTASCVTVDSATVSILPGADIIGRDTAICDGFPIDLKSLLSGTVSGSIKYGTSFGSYPDTISTIVTLSGTQTYFIENDIGGGCTDTTMLTITAVSCDLGDLPDSSATTNNADYQTLLANNGPVHVIIPGLSLGATVDGELDGQPSSDALGDGDDEDGLTIFSTLDLKPGITFKLPLSVTNTTTDTAYVEAWIDWNGDGDFEDANEMVLDIKDNADGNFPSILSATIPANATNGLIGVRIRVSNTDDMTPYGHQSTGEIEDYLIGIECPSIICIPTTMDINKRK